MTAQIPLVDFGKCGMLVKDGDIKQEDLKEAGDAIVEAFSSIGFCYLKNCGIPDEELEKFRAISRQFFGKPVEFKQMCKMGKLYHGWTPLQEEFTNPSRPGDLRESFNFLAFADWGDWPEGEFPEFKQSLQDLYSRGKMLAFRVLQAVVLGLGLPEDSDVMRCHSLVGQKGNLTALKTLLYPPLMDEADIKPNQVRLGEHSDFVSLTLLFQDDTGGLEVCNTDGEYVPATPIPGTVLVNIGQIMQRWTSDKLIATKHRVMLPKKSEDRKKVRQSAAFFLAPDDEAIIKCLDGTDKYPPVAYLGYLLEKMQGISKNY